VTSAAKRGPSGTIVSYLASNGPALTSEVVDYLASAGTSRAAARKAIERSRREVFRFKRIRFAHNQQFLFLPSQYKTPEFWSSLIRAFHKTKSAYGYAAHSLLTHGGAWPVAYFDIVSGSPERLSKHISSSTVLKRLCEIGLVELEEHPDVGSCAALTERAIGPSRRTAISGLRPRLIAEDILLSGLADWVRNTGLGSWNQVETRSLRRQPKFGQFRWDLSAPSFVYPIRSSRMEGPGAGFVVGDVLLGKEIETLDLGYFFEKATVMRQQPNTRPFLAIFLAERYTADALRAGRQMGLLLATTETLFGRRVAQGLTELVNVLSNAAAAVSADPRIVAELFGKLDELKGASLNVRGWLFELVAAQILRAGGWSVQSIGELRRDPTSGEAAEVDVLATRGTEALVVECKGYVNSQVSIDDAEKWLTKTVPRLRSSLLFEKFYQSKEITYQLWTTSTLSSDAAAYLKKKKMEIKKFTFDWLEGPGVMMLSKSSRSEYTTRVLREQYQLA
jgi:hypothetical protein